MTNVAESLRVLRDHLNSMWNMNMNMLDMPNDYKNSTSQSKVCPYYRIMHFNNSSLLLNFCLIIFVYIVFTLFLTRLLMDHWLRSTRPSAKF